MKKFVLAIFILSLTMLYVFFRYGSDISIIYDCDMAEWHPDIPKDVKEECRKLKMEQNKTRNYI